MRMLTPFLAYLLLVLTAWSGIAQANQIVCCPPMSQAAQTADPCMASQVPSEPDKRCPHCDASCHAQGVSTLTTSAPLAPAIAPDHAFRSQRNIALASHHVEQALRPPQA